ncbi:radical SAM protein [Rhizobium sp. BK176]|uniref:radical SAM protein n=1 Tax=Rhizobium sp. BK176 TaxID=2587071 RepID=UPI0021674C36|nr:radical SAM protein [Rhizobium sp. BK176]MCS4089487.1 sulfatase maturation enzyme AslB (radical SAM superfamily) [Rhizobium sp. BK176]
MEANTIENGYFVLTLMPSLFCHLRCPHCYLSLAERKDRTTLSPDLIEDACRKIDAYWDARGIAKRTVICYWYGGEPTSMGIPLFSDMADRINAVFDPAKGYEVRHTVLTSLVSMKDEWYDVFRKYGGNHFQTSYDGDMRGGPYVKKWDRRVRDSVAAGLDVSTISVVNREILEQGPVKTLDYLSDLGIVETSWLPFMWNDQNATGAYDRYAPTMNAWSDFMIALTERWIERKSSGLHVPEIGQMRFILAQGGRGLFANIAGQTMFLMPNGDFVLPDYRSGWKEFMQPFGNIVTQEFSDILNSPARRTYIRRQVTRNRNEECLSCEHADKCVMEFWKDNREGDDCFGGKRYVEWLLERKAGVAALLGPEASVSFY